MEKSSDPCHLTAASQYNSADHESRQNRIKALSLEVADRGSRV